MTIKSMATAVILLGSFIISQHTLAASDSISRQQAANPNHFREGKATKDVPKSISHCSASLLACAERVLSYGRAGLDSDVQLGKYISMAQLFIYPQTTSAHENQSDIGVVVITEDVTEDDSVAGERHRIAFIEQEDKQGKPYWKFISHREQWKCVRGRDGWSKNLCP